MKFQQYIKDETVTTDVEGYDIPVDNTKLLASFENEGVLEKLKKLVKNILDRGVSMSITSSNEVVFQGPEHLIEELREILLDKKIVKIH